MVGDVAYAVLLRGINVGGKNKVPMADLRRELEAAGFDNVRTYIQSGNVLVESTLSAKKVQDVVEALLPKAFRLDTEIVRVLVLTRDQLQEIVDDAPNGFGREPDKYHYDVVFYMGVGPDEVMETVAVNPDVDTAVAGDSALYFRRLSALRTKSRMSKIVGTPVYKSLTIRNWNTTTKMLEMLDD